MTTLHPVFKIYQKGMRKCARCGSYQFPRYMTDTLCDDCDRKLHPEDYPILSRRKSEFD